MVNKKIGIADKGSRHCLQNYMLNDLDGLSRQIIMASPSLTAFIESYNSIDWKSPLADKDFYEYRDDFLGDLGLTISIDDAERKLRQFWPKNGPQWDGLATVQGVNNEKGVLLIEAKAHPNETKSDLKAEAQTSIDLINNTMKYVQGYMGVVPCDWTRNYYQLGNRISYLYFMNVILSIPTWLVLLNFTEDISYKKTTQEEWLNHYNRLFKDMGLKHNCRLMDKIVLVFPEAL